ncbi:MAG TPA: hypothetical protein VGD78_10255 [Chthoniobacterales bacterium]
MTNPFNRMLKMNGAGLCSLALTVLTVTAPVQTWANADSFAFRMVPSNARVANALPQAHGWVKIESVGPVEIMDVKVVGLPPKTGFDFFVIQVPNPPFGLSWYQGDIETDAYGVGYGKFVGRFSIETFIVGPGSVQAPKVHQHPLPDAVMNPPTAGQGWPVPVLRSDAAPAAKGLVALPAPRSRRHASITPARGNAWKMSGRARGWI